jgi:XTP/dITP diphosphohydrolase
MAGQRLVVASHNPGKVWEIRKLIAPFGLEAVSAAALKLDEPDETETTFEGNARLKAVAAARSSGLPALADDSGLEVACLGGAPGIFSARWAGPTKDFGLAMRKVAEEVSARHGWSAPGPRANFICALCLAWPDGATDVFVGTVDGVLVWPPRGANGFGYDPMFLPDGHDITFGEMEPRDKNAMSHRLRAFAAFQASCLGTAGHGEGGRAAGAANGEPTAAEGLWAAAQSVSTREEFVRFVANLRDDLSGNGAGWENPTLERYLDAIGNYVTDAAVANEPVWRTMAKTLYAASRTARPPAAN